MTNYRLSEEERNLAIAVWVERTEDRPDEISRVAALFIEGHKPKFIRFCMECVRKLSLGSVGSTPVGYINLSERS